MASGGVATDGESRVDLHVKILDEGVVQRAKAVGLDAIVYAPHFEHLSTIRERADRFSDDDLLVVPGREYFTDKWSRRKHVLAVDPDEPVPDFISFEDTMAEISAHDAGILVPHPEFLTLSMTESDIAAYAEDIDAIEVYNPKHWPWDDRRAREIARESGLPTYLSSYAHLTTTIGEAWVEFDRPIDSAADLVDALQSAAPRRMYHRDGLSHVLKRRLEFAHLGWENSWDKFDRVVVKGDEPTHPDGDYPPRFADMNAYR